MNRWRWLSAGSAGSLLVGLVLCLGLVSAGVTREAPIGQIKGRITMEENGKALPDCEIVLRPVVDTSVSTEKAKEEGLPRYRYARTEDDGTFRISNVAAGKYTIEAYAQAHSMKPDEEVEIAEGKITSLDYALKPNDPSLDMYASEHVFQPSEQVKWDLHGFVEKANKVEVEVYKLRFDDVIREGTLYGALAPLGRRGGNAVDPASLGSLAQKKEVPIEGRDVEGTFRLNLFFEPLPEGLYWIRCRAGDMSAGSYVSVTKIGVVLKRTGLDVLAYATTLDTGTPVAGVKLGYPKNGAVVESATTGRDGQARFRLPGDLPESNAVVIARKDASTAFIDFYNRKHSTEPGKVYVYTDRPVYRPGDEVSYKGIIRKLVGSEYQVPPAGPVEIQVRDSDENLIDTKTLQSNGNGTFNGSFKTNKEAAPGLFRLSASYGNLDGAADVSIAAYRKPNYSIKVHPEKDHYIRGEKVRMIVECEYYFGGPVGGAKIEGSVMQSPEWTYYDADEESGSEYEGGYGGEYFTDVSGVTDSSGRAVIEFDTRLPKETKESWTDSKFTVNVSVADESGAYFEGEGSVTVSAGDFSLISESSNYVVEKAQPFEISYSTLNPSTKVPVEGKRIKVVAGYEYWDGLQDHFKVFAERTVTTGSDGKATVVVTPEKGGNVVIRASAMDDHGNEMKSENNVWCSSYSEPGYDSKYVEKLSLKLDKKQYNPGEKAKVLILCSEPGATALLTVEADKIYKAQLVKLDQKLTTVELPVAASYAPDVYVNACYIKDKEFHNKHKRLLVDLGKRTLKVSVKPDRETYKPGQTATYSIETKNANGRPTPAEVSLSVVDESIYAIKEDDTNLETGFYPKRSNEVETDYSFTTLYLDGGDKAPPGIEIRRKFKDTAYWAPTVQTDSSGHATVKVPLPDNLTTWRATVEAVDSSTAVGSAVEKVVARKPLMVRLQAPFFYIAGDTQRLAASVTNQTGKPADANVELTLSGATAGEGKRQSIHLEDGETKALEWNVTVGDPGEAVYTAKAWIDASTTDGVEGKVPILPRGRTEKSSTAGDVIQSTVVKLAVDPNADRTTGGVTLSLSPSLASPLFQSLDDLIGYPYGCVEQTMSRFMPSVVVSKVVQDLGLPKPRQASQIPAIAEDSFSRLDRMQNYSGGWGWWEFDQPDPRMTAYVLEGLYRAKLAGYTSEINTDKALKWAEKFLKEKVTFDPKKAWEYEWQENSRIYLAYSLTLYGKGEAGVKHMAQVKQDKVAPYALAMMAMAYHNLGPTYQAKQDAALAAMYAHAKRGAGTLFFEESYWGVESTARCLQAIVATNPTSTEIPSIVRYLMLSRRGDIWSSTEDTSIAILAIADYLKATQTQFNSASVAVWLNGKPLTVVTFSPRSVAEAAPRIEIPMRLLAPGENKIEIRKEGAGSCYYSAELTQTVVQPNLPPFSNLDGVKIERSYHRLEQQPLENGRMELVPSKEAVTTFQPGELVRCVVKVTTDREMRYLQVEDPVPSNCRIVEKENLDIGDNWSYWWINLAVRDDRVAYFATRVDKGSFELSYTMRAEQAGASSSLPSSVCEMYEPAKRAWSGVNRLEVAK